MSRSANSLEYQMTMRAQPTSQGNSGGRGTVVSNKSTDYKKYILYIVSNEPNSTRAVNAAAGVPDVMIQNVRNIPVVQRPRWLDRVPSLLSLDDNRCYTGTFCIDKLESIGKGLNAMPMDLVAAKTGSAENTSDELVFYSASSSSMRSKYGMFVPDVGKDDSRFSDNYKVSQADVDKLRSMREKPTSYRPNGTRM